MFPRVLSSARNFLALTFLVSAALAAHAQVVVTGYAQTGNLPANDDGFSSAVNLGFTINLGGTSYSSTFVGNNGYVTFGQASSAYTPAALNSSYSGPPIIAAFFSDVDTRASGSGIVEWGTGTVNGRNAFVVKWPSVGEYSFQPVYNSFGLVLVDRSDVSTGSFDLYFNYQQINWDHSNSNEVGAVAGYATGSSASNPQSYQLPGSMTAGAFLPTGANSLTSFSNTGAAGGFLLQSQGGTFLAPAQIVAVPEPSTCALLAAGAALLGLGSRRRRA